jgi:hypothetical protein
VTSDRSGPTSSLACHLPLVTSALARGLDQIAELLIELVDALVSFEVDDGEFLDHAVFLVHRNRFELVNFFLHVPQLADGLGQLSETLAQRAAEFGHHIAIFFVDLVLRKCQPRERNVAGMAALMNSSISCCSCVSCSPQALQTSSGSSRMPQFELYCRQLVAQ